MAAGVYKGLTIELNAKTTALSTALRQVEREAKGIEKELKQVEKAAELNPGGTATAQRQMELYRQAIDNAKEKLERLKAAESSVGEADVSSDTWTRLQSDIEQTTRKIEDYEQKLAKLQRPDLSSTGQSIIDYGEQYEKETQGLRSFGDAYTKGVTVPMVAGAAASVKAAVDVDTALTDVRKTVDGTEQDYRALRDAALEYSRTNAVSASEMLSIEALGAQLGFSLGELQEFGEVASGLDIATNMDAETAATEMAHFANIMGMSHDDISNYGSTLVDLGNHMATTESDISHMAQRIAGAGKQVGMSEADVLGMAAALSSVGIEAEAGGTAISTIMSQIDMDVAENGENLESWAAQAGMSAEDFAAAWKDDVPSALSALLSGMSQGVEEGGNMALMLDELGISSIRQTDTLKRLAGAGDLMSDSIGLANKAWSDNSALQAEVDNRNGSLAAQFEMLKNRVTEVAAEVGEPLAGALMDAIDAIQPLIDMVRDGAEAFNRMDEDTQRMMLTAAGGLAALGPLLSGVGRLGKPIQGVGKLVKGLGDALKGVGPLATSASAGLAGVAAAAALMGAAVALAKYGEYKQHMEDLATVSEGLSNAEGLAAAGFDQAGSAAETNAERVRALKQAADDTRRGLVDMVEGWADTWTGLYGDKANLDRALDAIDELAGRADLTEDQVTELQQAVDTYNQVTGESIGVTEDADGALQLIRDDAETSAEKLHELADAWYAAARQQAYAKQVTEAVEQQVAIEQQLDQANATVKDVEKAVAEAEAAGERWKQEHTNRFGTYDYKAWQSSDEYKEILEQKAALETAQDAAAELQDEYDQLGQTVEEYGKRASMSDQQMLESVTTNRELSAALKDAGVSASDFAQYMSEMGWDSEGAQGLADQEAIDRLVSYYQAAEAGAEKAGGSASEFAQAMSDAGITVSDMTGVTAEEFADLYERCGGDLERLKEVLSSLGGDAPDVDVDVHADTAEAQASLERLQALGLDPKTFTVDDAGTITDSEGRIVDLDAMTVDGKPFVVTDNGTIQVLGEEVQRVNDMPLYDKEADLRANNFVSGKVSSAQSSINGLRGTTVSINANDYASSVIADVKKKLAELSGSGASISISAIGGAIKSGMQARGGVAVPKHADGAIVTRATLTNVGLVGEAGAEALLPGRDGTAIVPLTNMRYVAPFADAVASRVAGAGAATVNNYYVGDVRYDDQSGVARAVGALVAAAGVDKRRRG